MTDISKPAFPRPASDYNYSQDGMTLREYYAGQVLAGLCADPNLIAQYGSLAKTCVGLADALIAELNK